MCALRQARILSSETDNTIKQEQNTNVNINIKPTQKRPSTVPVVYPEVQPFNNNVNFTTVNPQMGFQQCGEASTTAPNTTPESAYQYQPPINNPSQLVAERGITDLGSEIDDLEKKNRFLEMIVEMYESNPLKVNSYVVCDSKLLMNMIKLLTDCDKVDLVLNEDIGCSGCGGNSDKFIYVSKILISKNGKSEDMKYCYNDVYSQFIKYGISLKIVC